MVHARKIGLGLATAAWLFASGVMAEEPPHRGEPARPVMHPAEPHPGPSGYRRPEEPAGWNNRPAPGAFDRGQYQHNFQAARAYHVGAYRRPPGWAVHHWGYGMILPRAYWGPQYILADYWLFGLEVPPGGYEWVREDGDALLINTGTGEILQAEYGVFG
jgi:Ni/Co efflux regulator RcnB